MKRYAVKTTGVRIVDTQEDHNEVEFTEAQWSTAILLVRCYAKYGDRVAGIKFLSHQLELSIELARILYDAAQEHEY